MKLVLICLSITLCLAAQSRAPKLDFSPGMSTQGIIVAKRMQHRTIAVRELLVEGFYPDGHDMFGNLLVLFDSSSNLYFWQFRPQFRTSRLLTHLSELQKFELEGWYFGRDVIANFLLERSGIHATISRTTATSLDSAVQSALKEVVSTMAEAGYGTVNVPVGEQVFPVPGLSDEFFFPPGNAFPGPAWVTGVERNGSGWDIAIQGQWKEKLTLDGNNKIVGEVKVP